MIKESLSLFAIAMTITPFQLANTLIMPLFYQICECPLLFARLEVLNISGNRLTDACGSYLSTILTKCTGKLHGLLCQFEYGFCGLLKNTDSHFPAFATF